ncbi:MAG: hypothetical protein QOK42_1167 [Frankiaceae bacterium]|nr:hypothetical protein [Frankiaceae bacterium]
MTGPADQSPWSAPGQAAVDRLQTAPPPARPRVWLRIVVGLAAVAGLTLWWSHDRQRARADARRADQPVVAHLGELVAHGNPAGAQWMTVFVDDPQGTDPVPFDVVGLSLDAGTLGAVRAVVLNQFQGAGAGPLLQDVKPFRAGRLGVRADLTFEHPAVCGAPIPGDPPLVVEVRLPSGRTTTLRLRIDDVWNYRLGGSQSDAHRPWPVVLSEIACDGTF